MSNIYHKIDFIEKNKIFVKIHKKNVSYVTILKLIFVPKPKFAPCPEKFDLHQAPQDTFTKAICFRHFMCGQRQKNGT
jgi:hypothetical protein